MLALVVMRAAPTVPVAAASARPEVLDLDTHRLRGTFDGPQGQPVFEHRFLVTFRESTSQNRRIRSSHYPAWMGTLRENALLHTAPRLQQHLSGGEWGMVTNWTDVRIHGEATTGDVVQARLWMDDMDGSSVRLCCDFARALPDGSYVQIARCQQQTTWVRLNQRNDPSREPFPPFIVDFLQFMGPRDGVPMSPAPLEHASPLDAGPLRVHPTGSLVNARVLCTDEFMTSLEDANLIGNIYYTNYFNWQSRLHDLFLHSVMPDHFNRRGPGDGEFICARSRMDYLRDAFPFDRIRSTLSLHSASECGAILDFQFTRVRDGGSHEKLAVGRTEMVWVRRDREGSPVPARLPAPVFRAFSSGGAAQIGESAP
jgi:acyl-CoA thioesterase FadM